MVQYTAAILFHIFIIRLTVLPLIYLDSCKIWAPKNGAGAQKNARIPKSNARTWLKLGVGLDYMYTKGWNFFLQLCNVLME